MSIINKILGIFCAWVILAYQKTLSPDHGLWKVFYPYGFCRFYPTCSEYSKQAFLKYGFFKGIAFSLGRLGKCHPWHQGGVDSLPNNS